LNWSVFFTARRYDGAEYDVALCHNKIHEFQIFFKILQNLVKFSTTLSSVHRATSCLLRRIFRLCTALYGGVLPTVAVMSRRSETSLLKTTFIRTYELLLPALLSLLLLLLLRQLENIQGVNYAETTVEWEQWAVADSDSE